MNKLLGSILILSIIFTLSLGGYKILQSITHPIKYREIIESISEDYNLDSSLVASVINVESSYKNLTKSPKNAIGLMQIKLSTANYLNSLNNENNISENDLYDPTTNILYGCRYLRYLIDKFDNTYTALASYNAGETRVRSWLNDKNYSTDNKTLNYIPFRETREYVEKIRKNINFYSKIYKN